ncbi:hypothetical protein B9G69_016575 [Bdellovibrio sp. SKB1291214]|uniref:hypothetical protein n=1 Tax=Bdellovibrio sp. SKB1291214 TaxID=1732569 RepID=UPI000B51BE20|nr:hypothetical protein [Bdellovibrio sp. SKB1291214]UYL08659.1 hypothetical protein B9G69_016575 [Bdellovibrio sp. SKB1291214]
MKFVLSSMLVAALISAFAQTSSAKSTKKKSKTTNKVTASAPEATSSSTPTAAVAPAVTTAPSPASSLTSVTEVKEAKESDDYTRPVFFAVEEPNVKIKTPVISYDLKSDNGRSLKIADYVFNNDSLKASIQEKQLRIQWDTTIIPSGDLSIIDSYGKELWKVVLDKSGDWRFAELKGAKGPQWQSGSHFRFCLRSEIEKGFTAICTQNYGVEIKDDVVTLDFTKSDTQPRVIALNEERKKLKGEIEVAVGAPAGFLATIKSGATYEFMSEPIDLNLKDYIESEQKGSVTFKGALPAPLGDSKLIPGIEYGSMTKALGFQKSIAEPIDLWQIDVPLKNPRLHFQGKYGGVFTYGLEIKNYPKQADRIYIHKNALIGTYNSKDQIKVKVNKDSKIEGLEPADEKNKDSDLRVWKYQAEQKYALNKPQLLISEIETGKSEPQKAYLEIYRGGSGEASVRLSGLSTSSGGSTFIGELHLQYWFNDIFGWQNNYLSKQRWGVSAKHFSTLADVDAQKEGGGTEKVGLSSTQVDLRYRFAQGLWERDETVGAIFAYEALAVGEEKANKIGAGLFWARSMPKTLDNWLNKFSFLNHPKYVDMEYIQFFGSADSGTTMGMDFLLNFHGKILFTNNFFGELGFGMKKYDFTKADQSGASLSSFYGTVGVGVDF